MHGEVLDLIRISRTEMGAYLCIARNGVQPAVSKRIIFNVDCKCILSKYLALSLVMQADPLASKLQTFYLHMKNATTLKTPSFSQDE